MGELEPGQALPQGVVTHEWGFLPWPRDSRCLLLQGIASLIETNYETPCKTNVSDKHVKDLSTSDLCEHRNFGTSVFAQWYTY